MGTSKLIYTWKCQRKFGYPCQTIKKTCSTNLIKKEHTWPPSLVVVKTKGRKEIKISDLKLSTQPHYRACIRCHYDIRSLTD